MLQLTLLGDLKLEGIQVDEYVLMLDVPLKIEVVTRHCDGCQVGLLLHKTHLDKVCRVGRSEEQFNHSWDRVGSL